MLVGSLCDGAVVGVGTAEEGSILVDLVGVVEADSFTLFLCRGVGMTSASRLGTSTANIKLV